MSEMQNATKEETINMMQVTIPSQGIDGDTDRVDDHPRICAVYHVAMVDQSWNGTQPHIHIDMIENTDYIGLLLQTPRR